MIARPAHGAASEEPAEAKAHYQKATAHFAVGEYKEAAAEYEAAFKIHQHPALLYNAAQSHRLAGDNQKALILYKNLVKLYPDTKYASDSKERIQKLEQAIASTQSPPNGPAPIEAGGAGPGPTALGEPTRPAPAPVPTLAAPPPPPSSSASGAPAASLVAAPAPASGEPTPIYKKWWFWTGAGAVAVAAVVIVVAASGGTTAWANLPEVRGALSSGVRW